MIGLWMHYYCDLSRAVCHHSLGVTLPVLDYISTLSLANENAMMSKDNLLDLRCYTQFLFSRATENYCLPGK